LATGWLADGLAAAELLAELAELAEVVGGWTARLFEVQAAVTSIAPAATSADNRVARRAAGMA